MDLTLMSILTALMFLFTLPLINFQIKFNFMSQMNNFKINIIMDSPAIIFIMSIILISSIVMFFSYIYMKKNNLFILILIMFILSMLILIIMPQPMVMLIGWDGLGISSFLLINFYNNSKTQYSAILTTLTNRMGDALIMISSSLILFNSNYFLLNMMMWSLVLGLMTKTAQFPFSSWLPAAMAAPTPVSALVHSSTLVTAGIYIMYRYNAIHFNKMETFLLILSSTMTLMMSSLAAIQCKDLKKIIAFSTLSQLSIMLFALIMKMPNLAMIHLLSHAYFKSMLFIMGGMLIMYNMHSQDLRTSNSFFYNSSLMFLLFSSSFSLAALPFSSGFMSKDSILDSSNTSMLNSSFYMIMLSSTFLTSIYTFNLFKNNLNNKMKKTMTVNLMYNNLFLMPLFLLSTLSAWLIFYWIKPMFFEIALMKILKMIPLIVSSVSSIMIIKMNPTFNSPLFYNMNLPKITSKFYHNFLYLFNSQWNIMIEQNFKPNNMTWISNMKLKFNHAPLKLSLIMIILFMTI